MTNVRLYILIYFSAIYEQFIEYFQNIRTFSILGYSIIRGSVL